MTRFLYNDPLAAAWMAKHFGMQFRYWRWNNLSFQFMPVNARAVELDSSKLYIHPDSLPLLEPVFRDVLEWGEIDTNYSMVCDRPSDLRHAKSLLKKYNGRIIQRDGKAVMWPESEAT